MRLEVRERAAASLLRGHPWVFREALAKPPKKLATGSVVDLVHEGRFLGRGLWDEASPIAVRIYEHDEAQKLDARRIADAVEHAFAKRDALFDDATTAYRLCNGEGDRVPGIVVDRYGDAAIVRLDGDAIAAWLSELGGPIAAACAKRGLATVALRVSSRERTDDGGAKIRMLRGAEPKEPVDVREHGMIFEVDLLHGQKTGAFLDQRENRRRVREIVRPGGRVLNLFSYTGGFSLAAALGGASRVVSVDVAAKGHASAQRSFKKNGVDPSAHDFVTADALAYVAELGRRRAQFDLVVSDPPSFAPNERSVDRALGAYAKLHRACAALLAPGGVLCAASCSSHVGMEAFLGTLDDKALGRSDLSVRALHGPPPDHPSPACFPEGRYLKLVELA
jgi:23S rRNA (cytosine1962-C5)-methyltransferase